MNVEVQTDLNAVVVAAGDWSATRTVYGVVVALGLIGVALLLLAIWLIKQTKPEPPLLAPLERMDDRSWRKQEPAQRRRDLDSLRPDGAIPVAPEKGVPDIDTDFAQNRPTLGNFDDLQAQAAADVRRTASAGADPLLSDTAVDADAAAVPNDDIAEPSAPANSAPANSAPTSSAPASSATELSAPASGASASSPAPGTPLTGAPAPGSAADDIEIEQFDVRPAPTHSDEHPETE